MDGMQGIFLVELVREGVVMTILAGHWREEKSLFLSLRVFILHLK
jgi:hypothetical protein